MSRWSEWVEVSALRRVAGVERQALIDALAAAGGKQNVAARTLGISRFALMRLMEKHELKKR